MGTSIVGGSFAADNWPFRPTLWHGGTIADLGTLGGEDGVAFSINSIGQSVGGSMRAGGTVFHATGWSGGATTDLGAAGPQQSIAYSINDAGQAVGEITDAAGTYAALFSGGTVTVLSNVSGSKAFDINVQGQVVGESVSKFSPRATLWANGSVTDLGTLAGGSFARALGINNTGQVVGASEAAGIGGVVVRAALWSGGVVTDLGSLGGSVSFASDVNNVGQVVGGSLTPDGLYFHATLWNGGVVIDLNDFLSAADRSAGWVLTDQSYFNGPGIAINDNGWIVADAQNTLTGGYRAYRLTPTAAVPEPAGWALMLGGLALVSARWRRHRSPD